MTPLRLTKQPCLGQSQSYNAHVSSATDWKGILYMYIYIYIYLHMYLLTTQTLVAAPVIHVEIHS